MGVRFPLTPALSLGERETARVRSAECRVQSFGSRSRWRGRGRGAVLFIEDVERDVLDLGAAGLAVLFMGAEDDAHDVGEVAVVAGVEDAAQEVVFADGFVEFVGDQGDFAGMDGAVHGRGADVRGDFGAIDQAADDAQEGGLAATVPRGFDAEVGGDVAQFPGVGVEDEEGNGFGGPLGQDGEAVEGEDEGVQDVEGGGMLPILNRRQRSVLGS